MPIKRLRKILQQMELNTSTYTEMYNGKICIANNPPIIDYSPIYYSDSGVGFEITPTHKLAQDKPTVTVIIPAYRIGISEPSDAAADFCIRALRPYIDVLNDGLYNRSRPDSENGKYYLPTLGGEVIKRNCAYFAVCEQKDYENGSGNTVFLINDGIERPPIMCLCIKMQVQLPKRNLKKTVRMLCSDLPEAVDTFISELDLAGLDSAILLADKQRRIREYLKGSEYCAFVANGSVLPRAKSSDLPMQNAIPFFSPREDEIELFGVRGMGIKRGVTVITGGGYSGKSTLLNAIAAGVYDHIAGDGRELCISDESAVTVCAEDTRSVKSVNISPFIKWLPTGDTKNFSTACASGSTSQAANIMEAVDFGSKLLLIDEDKSATNFMIRDSLMKELIKKEPITPFTDRVNALYSDMGVSSILVIGGSSEYLGVADRVYMMDDFKINDVTSEARTLCKSYGFKRDAVSSADWTQTGRELYSQGFSSYPDGEKSERLEIFDLGFIVIGDEKIDVRSLRNIVSPRQLDALGFMLRYLEISNSDFRINIREKIDSLYEKIGREGLDFLYSGYFTTCQRFLDLPRKYELMAVINRMRGVVLKKTLSQHEDDF